MSDKNLARRTGVQVSFAGVDITKSIIPYLISMTYTDQESDETDDLQIKLQDRAGLWLSDWLDKMIVAAADSEEVSLAISAVIVRENWKTDGADEVLDCGTFELDSVTASGPPSEITIKATALPFSGSVRQTKKWRAWEAYTLSRIASEICGNAGLSLMYESASDPYYARAEQFEQSDVEFLAKLCRDAGISLKTAGNILVLFDQPTYEAKAETMTITRGDGSYIKYKLDSGSADTQYGACRCSYVDPETGQCIEATVTAGEDDKNSDQVLEITRKVSSVAEAQMIAAKQLRLHNKFERTATFTLPGNPGLAAGITVMLTDFGGWSGKYMIKTAKHTVSASGYTTQLTLRRVLEGY